MSLDIIISTSSAAALRSWRDLGGIVLPEMETHCHWGTSGGLHHGGRRYLSGGGGGYEEGAGEAAAQCRVGLPSGRWGLRRLDELPLGLQPENRADGYRPGDAGHSASLSRHVRFVVDRPLPAALRELRRADHLDVCPRDRCGLTQEMPDRHSLMPIACSCTKRALLRP